MATGQTASATSLDPSTKIRKLPLKHFNKLITIMSRDDCWKQLAAFITHPDNPEEMLFTAEDISALEREWKNDSSPAESMLHYWRSYGRDQPSLIDLVRFLKVAGLYRAAFEVEKEFFTDCNLSCSMVDESFKPGLQEYPEVDIIADVLAEVDLNELTLFPYQDLYVATQGFSERPASEGGSKVGEGAYGCVYKAEMSNAAVAVKKLKDAVDRQFITELTILTKFKHENLLPLLGCSLNGPLCCLVYKFMPNGSLHERLACVGETLPLSWETRVSVAYGSACGINHLHTYGEKPMVHRDIKSANILLDENFVPKVGDFGLVRIGNSSATATMAVTQNIYGTSVYMAREAFYGDVSVKLDSFSFGVVLLELLTGLPPFDASREDRDLVTFMENCDDIISTYDSKIEWPEEAASALYRIAKKCLADSKRVRPAISEVLDDLKNILPNSIHDEMSSRSLICG